MNHLIKIITISLFGLIITATIAFTFLQLQRSQILDENLISNLTTQLDTKAIDQAIKNINNQNE